jgi:hypothetical protein
MSSAVLHSKQELSMPLRYVWVNEALKPMKAFCAFDHISLVEGYVRELSTGLLYHDACCLEHHALVCEEEVVSHAKAS